MIPTTGDENVQPQQIASPTQPGSTEITFVGSRSLANWLGEQRVSLIFSTYQSGRIFFIGLRPNGRLSLFERSFRHCMGLCGNDQNLYLTTLYQLWRFDNALEPGHTYEGFDRLYVPQVSYATGLVDAHDVAMDKHGRPIFINTRFSCLCTISESHSFEMLWKPPFISELRGQDRCHLNGLAMENDKPKYVTALAATDTRRGWSEHRREGGIIMDVQSDQIILDGLSMPHSPRLYRNKLWVLNTGEGHLGYVDFENGRFGKPGKNKFVPISVCRGFARGLVFVGDYAVVGLSTTRKNKTFSGLALDDELAKHNIEPLPGLQVININTGETCAYVTFDKVIEELYDIIALPNVIRPMAFSLTREDMRRAVTIKTGKLPKA